MRHRLTNSQGGLTKLTPRQFPAVWSPLIADCETSCNAQAPGTSVVEMLVPSVGRRVISALANNVRSAIKATHAGYRIRPN